MKEDKLTTIYSDKEFLNDEKSPSVGFIQGFLGTFHENNDKEDDISAWLRIGDCHQISCLHKTNFDTLEDFLKKMTKVRNFIDRFMSAIQQEIHKDEIVQSIDKKYIIDLDPDFRVIGVSIYDFNPKRTDPCWMISYGIAQDGYVHSVTEMSTTIEQFNSVRNIVYNDNDAKWLAEMASVYYGLAEGIPGFNERYLKAAADAIDIREFAFPK